MLRTLILACAASFSGMAALAHFGATGVTSERMDAMVALGGAQMTEVFPDGLNGKMSGVLNTISIPPSQLLATDWEADDLVYAPGAGITPEADVFGGSMENVVSYGTAFLRDADIGAMASYIMDSTLSEQ